jgi:acetoin utilization protein AcuB
MRVAERMRTDVAVLRPEDSLARAEHLMRRHAVRALAVVRKSRLVGLLRHTDLATAFPSAATTLTRGEIGFRLDRLPVSRVLTREIIAVGPGTPLVEAARLMRARKLGALPVVRGEELLGLLTEADLLAALEELLGG